MPIDEIRQAFYKEGEEDASRTDVELFKFKRGEESEEYSLYLTSDTGFYVTPNLSGVEKEFFELGNWDESYYSEEFEITDEYLGLEETYGECIILSFGDTVFDSTVPIAQAYIKKHI